MSQSAARFVLLVFATLSGLAPSVTSAQTFLGPTPYLCKGDSPFIASINAGTTFLETFESGALTVPGVTASTGSVVGPGGLTDSVDCDDGTIDGSGTNGHSFFSGDGASGITFTFHADVLGHLPTQAGIVWTDGAGTTTFEAFGPTGTSLGTIGPVSIADGSFSGTTAEDRFFGVTFAGGISAIKISNTSGGIEVDHLQYGIFQPAPYIQKSFAACMGPPAGMIGWWRAEGNASDSADSNNGALQNGAGFAAGRVGQGFNFTALNQSVEVPDSPSLELTGAVTLEAWVSPAQFGEATDGTTFISKGDLFVANNQSYDLVYSHTGNVYMRVGNSSTLDEVRSNTVLPLNTFSHVVGTYDGTTLKIYVNGVLENSRISSNGPMLVNNIPLRIGANNFNGFVGIIDEATVYNRALSDSEVNALFNAGSAGKCAPIPAIPLNGTAPLTFTLSNTKPGNLALTGVAFTDTLPGGLVIATPSGLNGSCGGGTIAATAGGSAISLSGASLAAGASCTFGVNVTGTSGGVKNNTTGAISSNESLAGDTASASLAVVAPSPAFIQKSFAACMTPPSAMAAWWPGDGNANDIVGSNQGSYGGAFAAGKVGQAFSLDGSDSVSITHTSQLDFGPTDSFSVDAWINTSSVPDPEAAMILSLTYHCTNELIALQVGADAANNVGEFVIRDNNGNQVTLLTPGSVKDGTFHHLAGVRDVATQTVRLYLDGVLVDSKPDITTGTFTRADAQDTIGQRPTCGTNEFFVGLIDEVEVYRRALSDSEVKALFNVGSAGKCKATPTTPPNTATPLTFTIINPPANPGALTGIAFNDSLPAGLTVANPNGLTNGCGGTATATAGSGTVTLSGGSIATPGNSCTITVNVTGSAEGTKNNSVSVTSTQGGTGNTANASVTITPLPPVIAKNFLSQTIQAGAGSQAGLHFSINNPNSTTTLTGIGFTDTLPGGLLVNTPNGLIAGCSGVTATAGSNVISMTGGTLGPGLTCTIDVTITAPANTPAGLKQNVTSNVTSTEAGPGNSASASITVTTPAPVPPSFSKQFGAATIALNGTTTLTFTITNGNQSTLTGVAFSDPLPSGLVVATPNGLTGSCGGGTITATAGSGTVSLSGATLTAGQQCQFGVNVTGTSAGVKSNVTGTISSTESGAGTTASANITVVAPPTIGKAFGAASIPLNGSTALTFTLTNPNTTTALTGIGFTDTLPAGLVVATPNGLSGACGGGTITATAASGSVTLAGATLAASTQCSFSVNVTGTTGGAKNNSVTASSANGGAGNTSNASVTVVSTSAATLAKSFGAAALSPGGTTTLTFTLTNPNAATTLTGVGFTDPLPSGLVVSIPNGLIGSCGGGTITAAAGSGSVSLAGATLAGNSSCSFSVNVTATGSGTQNNTTSAVTSVEGGNGAPATASLTIVLPAPSNIPTLQAWAIALLALLLSATAFVSARRKGLLRR